MLRLRGALPFIHLGRSFAITEIRRRDPRTLTFILAYNDMRSAQRNEVGISCCLETSIGYDFRTAGMQCARELIGEIQAGNFEPAIQSLLDEEYEESDVGGEG